MCHQRRTRKSNYDIPTTHHGPPHYTTSQGLTSLANENAIYETMPESKSLNMEMSTETFRNTQRTTSTAPLLLSLPETHKPGTEDSMYELDDETPPTKSAAGTKKVTNVDSPSSEGLYVMDDVPSGQNESSEGYIEVIERGNLPLLKDATHPEESYYEMDDPV